MIRYAYNVNCKYKYLSWFEALPLSMSIKGEKIFSFIPSITGILSSSFVLSSNTETASVSGVVVSTLDSSGTGFTTVGSSWDSKDNTLFSGWYAEI